MAGAGRASGWLSEAAVEGGERCCGPKKRRVIERWHLVSISHQARSSGHMELSRGSCEMLPEEVDRSLPNQLGGGILIAWRRVVVKTVLRAGIHVRLVGNAAGS